MKKILYILFFTFAVSHFTFAQILFPAKSGYQNPVYVGGHAAGDTSIVKQAVPDSLRALVSIYQTGTANDVDANITNATIAVTGTFWQATQPVSGTFFQAKQPISISQTTTDNDVDANITNSSIAVSGTFWQATQPVSGTFWQATQPVSGTFFQAKQPISISQTTTDNDVDANITNATLAVTQSGTWNIGSITTLPALTDKSANANNNVIGNVSLGNSQSKTITMKTGNLVTTATTADQVILTYTVTSGKTFYLQYINWSVRLTTYATTATNFGTVSFENPSGTKLHTGLTAHAGVIFPPFQIIFAEPIPIAATTVIRIVCTPAATTSFTWQGNFGGYEK